MIADDDIKCYRCQCKGVCQYDQSVKNCLMLIADVTGTDKQAEQWKELFSHLRYSLGEICSYFQEL